MEKKFLDNTGLLHIITQFFSIFAKIGHTHTKSQISDFPTIPTKTSQLTNDSGFLTTDKNTTYELSKSADGSSIILTGSDGSTTSVADSDTKITVDSSLSSTSTNPVQNKVINSALGNIESNLNDHIDDADVHITEAERTKLNGIAAGAQVNTVTGVKGNSESSYRTGNINITKSNIGLGNVDNTSDANKPVSTAQQSAINSALASANLYTDTKIDSIVGEGASTTLDTIGEISSAIEENQDMLDTLNNAIGNKANSSDLTSHTGNTSNPHGVTKSQVGLGNVPNVATNNQTPTYTQASTLANLVSGEKLSVSMGKIMKAIADLISHIGNTSNPHSVTKSQIGLGSVENKSSATIRGELTKQNVTDALGYTPPETNTDTVYTHPTGSGYKHIPSGGSSGQILRWSADGTAVWGADNNTTYSNFVKSGSGAKAGLVPAPSTTAGTTKYLREDGTWAVPPDNNTVYSHPTSGATAGSYGDSSAQTPAYGGTFKVPYVTVDANGHVTGISAHTVKIPASDNSDTKNTAGSTDSSSKLFLIGATSQAANPQTYSHDTVYVGTNGHLYSNGKQAVNLSDTQALTNKTYNGYTLAAACAKDVATVSETETYLGI